MNARNENNLRGCDRTRLRIATALMGIVAAFVLLVAPSVHADTIDHEFAVEDAGRASCRTYTQARDSSPQSAARYIGFIEGYLTAANRYEPNTFDLTPWHSTEAFALILDQHCRRAPTEPLAMVAQRLVISMMPHRLASKSEMVKVGDGPNSTIVYEKIIWRAQSELFRHGLFTGDIDGKDSPSFRAALTRFQQLANLDQSGIPDVATLWVLLNP